MSTQQNPAHAYTSIGNYSPNLVATNCNGFMVQGTGPIITAGMRSLYSFTNGIDGADPYAGLVLSGETLYGTAAEGAGAGHGAVFALNTNGSGFTNLYSFTNGIDGGSPFAGLVLSGDTLYGTAIGGGNAGIGSVFTLNTNGSDFTNLYSFTNGVDGADPFAGLVLSGDTLYGTASQGGGAGNGTVFALNTNGSGFTNLYSFTNGIDGAYPFAVLLDFSGVF